MKLAKEIAVACRCPRCEEVNLVRVGADDIVAWKVDGVPVQGAFPYLDADQREMLMTGICGTCWDKMFAEDGEQ